MRFFIPDESLMALRIITKRWALAVLVKLLMDDLFDVSLQQIKLIAIGPNTLRRAEREIAFCEHCHPHDSEIPFDWLITEVTGKRGPYEFILGGHAVRIVRPRSVRKLWLSRRISSSIAHRVE